MDTERFLLAIDQGTTSTRAILFDRRGLPRASAQTELRQHYPAPGLVEHDPEEIWEATRSVCREALAAAGAGPEAVEAIGITNQRETALLWERATGRPLHRAIVWQDRRTAGDCERLRTEGLEERIRERTGLLLDPYFSATKLAWMLREIPGARAAAERGELAFGTVESFLLWRLSGGHVHATDASNASRTLLYDLRRGDWDPELLEIFGIPDSVLPRVVDCSGELGAAEEEFLGRPLPVTGMAGDQQAATFGQVCLEPGMSKCTYGTGAFLLLNTGDTPVPSRNRLLTTVAWSLEGRRTYALEGSIFSAGSTVQWLRDGLGLVREAAETEALARQAAEDSGVVLVPAFTGLGAPWWDAEARAAILGLTRGSGRAEIARAALEAVAFQTRDLLEAMAADGAAAPVEMRVDGGMVRNDLLLQLLADQLGVPVARPRVQETTARGAAFLAGLATGFLRWEELPGLWEREARFEPALEPGRRDALHARWREAVERVRSRP